jgi:DNA-directed RNA polymerase subunit L
MKEINIEDLSAFNIEIKEKEASDIGTSITKIRNEVVFGDKNEDRAYVYHVKTQNQPKKDAPFFMTSKNTWENVIEKKINNSRNICSVLKNLINEEEDCIKLEYQGAQFIVHALEHNQYIQNKNNTQTLEALEMLYSAIAKMCKDKSVNHILQTIQGFIEMSKTQTNNNLTNIN